MSSSLSRIFQKKSITASEKNLLWQVNGSEHTHGSTHSSGHGSSSASEFQQQMDTDMLKMMNDMHGPGYSGDPDIDFLTMMIPHHQGAVDMARLALVYGSDALSRTLAEGIISNQTTEIMAMTARLETLEKQRATGIKEFPTLSGTRGSGVL